MIKLSYRFSILIFLITIIIITLAFCKYKDEYFSNLYNIQLMPSIQFNAEDLIVILHRNNDNVMRKIFREFTQTTLKKNLNFYYSNLKIYSSTDLRNGFFFKPNQIKDLIIGLHHFKEKDIDNKKVLSNLNFSYKINDNNLKIIENGIEETFDFCSDPSIRLCNSSKDFNLKNKNYLGMVIHNSHIHYVIINKTKSDMKGILIHRSAKPITYPINLCIINKKEDNKLNDLVWLSSYLMNKTNIPWSLELENKNIYNARKIPKKKPLNRPDKPKVIEPPIFTEIDPFYNLPEWAKKIEILDASRDNDIITLKLKFYNIDQLYLNNMYQIKVKLWNVDDDNKLNIPLKDKLILKNKIVDNISIDISNYGNIFYQNKIKVQVIGLISKFSQDIFNMNSNIVTL